MASPAKVPIGRRAWLKLGAIAVACTLLVAVAMIAPAFYVSFVPRSGRRSAAIATLLTIEVAYAGLVTAAVLAIPIFTIRVVRARRRGERRRRSARSLLVAVSLLFSSMLAEVAIAVLRSEPSIRFEGNPEDLSSAWSKAGDPGELTVAVIGESSAEGVPYHKYLSVGRIVAWRLGVANPGRRVRLDDQARAGLTLEKMHRKLAERPHRPDILIVYAGHNEFASRHGWDDGIPYYRDAEAPWIWESFQAVARRVSPLCVLIQEAVAEQRVDEPPYPWVTRRLVDVPVYTRAEYAARLDDFRTRLDAIATACRRSGVFVVFVIPPANDAGFEPNRSFLLPETSRADRQTFEREFRAARASESADPARSREVYERLIGRQPTLAEAHYRLAKLMESAGEWDGAYSHYVSARDLDGLPMRCPSDFQDAYRDVAARHGAALVDGQALFRSLSPRRLLDDDLFNDAMHPSLRGHVAIAGAVLERLREGPRFGRPEAADAAACAEHFGMDLGAWREVCRGIAHIWRMLAYARHDPTRRLANAKTFEGAMKRLGPDVRPDDLNIRGLGTAPVNSGLAAPARVE